MERWKEQPGSVQEMRPRRCSSCCGCPLRNLLRRPLPLIDLGRKRSEWGSSNVKEFRAELAGLFLCYDQFVSFRPWANLRGLSSTSRQQVSCNIVLTPKLDSMPFALVHFLSFFILSPYKFEEPSLSTGIATSTDTILRQKILRPLPRTFSQNGDASLVWRPSFACYFQSDAIFAHPESNSHGTRFRRPVPSIIFS